VLHLADLAEMLKGALAAMGREAWHQEECARLVTSQFVARESDPENDWRLKVSNALTSRERTFLRALWEAREERAREIDRPPFSVLTNDRLLSAAKAAASGETDIGKIMPSGRPLPSSLVAMLRKALESARRVEAADWPAARRGERVEPDPTLERAVDSLKVRRDARAKALGLDPGVVASRSVLAAASMSSIRLARPAASSSRAETICSSTAASAFMAPAASAIACRRLIGSATWVLMFTRLSVACVVYSALPGWRSDIGIAAINGFFGTPPCPAR